MDLPTMSQTCSIRLKSGFRDKDFQGLEATLAQTIADCLCSQGWLKPARWRKKSLTRRMGLSGVFFGRVFPVSFSWCIG